LDALEFEFYYTNRALVSIRVGKVHFGGTFTKVQTPPVAYPEIFLRRGFEFFEEGD